MKEKINKLREEQNKMATQRYVDTLEQAIKLREDGKEAAANQLLLDMRAELEAKLNGLKEKRREQSGENHKNFRRDSLPAPGEMLGVNSRVRLIAFDESHRSLFLKAEEADSCMKKMFRNENFCNNMWNECREETALYYAVEDWKRSEYIGYIGIKNTQDSIWELGIVLLPEFRFHDYGKEASTILLDELWKRTGEKLFRARVYPDNYASQALMRKLGARDNGISDFLLHGEQLEQFQKENRGQIDKRLEDIAELFCVDAEDLLGHVLEYLIEWPNPGHE